MSDDKGELIDLMRKAIEIAMPDMRQSYRTTRKGKVVNVYPSDGGSYYADVKPLRNDDSEDPNEPIVPKVEIPAIWGGPGRGVVCPPSVGVFCDISYYDGDPNFPRISNIRGNMGMPQAALNEFVIQLEPGVEIRIDASKKIIMLTSSDWKVAVEGNASIEAGNLVDLKAGEVIGLTAPAIELNGRIIARDIDGEGRTTMRLVGDLSIDGSTDTSGNSYAGSRSGGACPHHD